MARGLRTGHGVDGREAGVQCLDQRGDLWIEVLARTRIGALHVAGVLHATHGGRDAGRSGRSGCKGRRHPLRAALRRCARCPSPSSVPGRPAADRTSSDSSGHTPRLQRRPRPDSRSALRRNRTRAATPRARTPCRGPAPWPVRPRVGSCWRSSTWSCGPADPPQHARRSRPGSPCRRRCSARADGRRRGSGVARHHPVADLLEVDNIGSVQNRKVYDKPSGAVQFGQQRAGCSHQAILVHGQRAQLHQAHAELVVATATAQPAQLHQALEHPVRRRAGQARCDGRSGRASAVPVPRKHRGPARCGRSPRSGWLARRSRRLSTAR